MNAKQLLFTVSSVLPRPCTVDPFVNHLKSSSGRSWTQLKQTNESQRQDLTATKDFSYKLSSSKHLKNIPRLLKTLLQCVNPKYLLQRRQSFSCFQSGAIGAVVGLGYTLSATWRIREVERAEGKQEAGMCSGAVGLQEVALEPDHSVAPHPMPRFQ